MVNNDTLNDLVYCEDCQVVIGIHKENWAEEHLKKYPTHKKYASRTFNTEQYNMSKLIVETLIEIAKTGDTSLTRGIVNPPKYDQENIKRFLEVMTCKNIEDITV
jgi:hypothetical protein